jgi:hypothetical protein
MRHRTLLLLVLIVVPGPVLAETFTQSDWSGGGGASGPVLEWDRAFESSQTISWQSVPGQLALASEPLTSCVKHGISAAYHRSFGIFATDMDGDGDTDVRASEWGSTPTQEQRSQP